MKTLIKNAQIVNENQIFKGDLLIENDLILKQKIRDKEKELLSKVIMFKVE